MVLVGVRLWLVLTDSFSSLRRSFLLFLSCPRPMDGVVRVTLSGSSSGLPPPPPTADRDLDSHGLGLGGGDISLCLFSVESCWAPSLDRPWDEDEDGGGDGGVWMVSFDELACEENGSKSDAGPGRLWEDALLEWVATRGDVDRDGAGEGRAVTSDGSLGRRPANGREGRGGESSGPGPSLRARPSANEPGRANDAHVLSSSRWTLLYSVNTVVGPGTVVSALGVPPTRRTARAKGGGAHSVGATSPSTSPYPEQARLTHQVIGLVLRIPCRRGRR